MEEQKIENFTGEQKPMPVGEAMPAEMPMQAPSQVSEPISTPMPPAPTEPRQQSMSNMPPVMPEVERMQIPMQPIDLSDQAGAPAQPAGITMQMESPSGGGNKKAIIIGAVVIGLLVVVAGAFFAWRSMSQPVQDISGIEQAATPISLPTTPTEAVILTPVVEADDLSIIEQDLNAFNIGGIDTEIEAELNEISTSL